MMNDNNSSGGSKKRPINLVGDDDDVDDGVSRATSPLMTLPEEILISICRFATATVNGIDDADITHYRAPMRFAAAARLSRCCKSLRRTVGTIVTQDVVDRSGGCKCGCVIQVRRWLQCEPTIGKRCQLYCRYVRHTRALPWKTFATVC